VAARVFDFAIVSGNYRNAGQLAVQDEAARNHLAAGHPTSS